MLETVLRSCLVQCVAAARELRHEAPHLVPRHLAEALLGGDLSLPLDVQRAGLQLLFAVRVVGASWPVEAFEG